jgi:hypothetical protein
MSLRACGKNKLQVLTRRSQNEIRAVKHHIFFAAEFDEEVFMYNI